MTPGEASTLYETEYRKGEDSYQRSVGHAVLPSGQLIAMWQGEECDDLNVALFKEVWSLYLNHECPDCGGDGYELVAGHDPGCWGNCEKHGCPVQVPEQCRRCDGTGVVRG